ncbi:MAG: rhodanese-like domain-containing protein [Flavobacteriaceae bacterium]|nr:rhodanese-like domain-containing protein [Flavobacteriaceae bacterium]MCB0475115.1 rhodanese-like domain-containing protein [Flavobacteriaceae bacterium]
MKKTKFLLPLIFIMAIMVGSVNKIYAQDTEIATTEFDKLVNYIETNANFINGDLATLIVNAGEVKDNLKNEKYLVIDIRSESWFEYGHIKNAKNVKAAELLNFFKNDIKPADFEKIVMVCYSGQSASYFASLLRLAGYDNVYSMQYGMSSWRLDFAENAWLKNIKDDFAGKLETTENARPEKGAEPVINTGKTEPKEILEARVSEIMAKPYSDFTVKTEDVFANPGNFYVVDYASADDYNKGHIPGAVLYGPGCFAADKGLLTLPTDKKIAVYSMTGLESAYIVAYLNVLGYDVANIPYGNNGFMNSELKGHKDGFTKKQINTYPVVE